VRSLIAGVFFFTNFSIRSSKDFVRRSEIIMRGLGLATVDLCVQVYHSSIVCLFISTRARATITVRHPAKMSVDAFDLTFSQINRDNPFAVARIDIVFFLYTYFQIAAVMEVISSSITQCDCHCHNPLCDGVVSLITSII
jgi:hypothetical protein